MLRLAALALVSLAMLTLGVPQAAADDKQGAPRVPDDDVIVLNTGAEFRGRIVREEGNQLVLALGSKGGGSAHITFARGDIRAIRRGKGGSAAIGGTRAIREEWFLLRSEDRIVGTRHLQLWSVRTEGQPGYRIQEDRVYFAQGPELPATRTRLEEYVDLQFMPSLVSFREIGDSSSDPDGPARYERTVTGRIVDGVWRAATRESGAARRIEVRVPENGRGRLGLREYLLRVPRSVRLYDARVLDAGAGGIVAVRAGFASCPSRGPAAGNGHEFHWEENGRRLISYFHPDTRSIREEIAEGVTAVRVSRAQAEAAGGESSEGPGDPGDSQIRLPEAGISFALPDRLWTWKKSIGSPANTGWRVLGRADSRVFLADARIEWHPRAAGKAAEPVQVEAWLLRRLRGACPDLRILSGRRGIAVQAESGRRAAPAHAATGGAWRMEMLGTLKEESVRTVAVVVDRPLGRVVLLLACPASAWEQARPALDRFITSLRLL